MNKKALSMILCLSIATSILANTTLWFNASAQELVIVYVDPPEQTVNVCSNFYVYVQISGVPEQMPVTDYDFFLHYDASKMNPVSASDGGFLQPQVTFTWEMLPGLPIVHCWAYTSDGGSIGAGTLAVIEFHCVAPGDSLSYLDVMLSSYQTHFPPDIVNGGTVHQVQPPPELYWKENWTDYAPSGMPDFDQKQSGTTPQRTWTNPYPPIGTPSYCGPTALANSFWWLDSKFEPNPVPPPTINDGFPLVQSYGQWDDHDPLNVPYLIEDLAWYIDTDAIRTSIPHCGTEVHEMVRGIDMYLNAKGLSDKFYVHLVKEPEFKYIEQEFEKCQDVIILLGFWQLKTTGFWERIGGHFVTVAGINSSTLDIAISDPYMDAAELGAPGQVIPPGHAHPPIDTWKLHNNATYVSHDIYRAYSPSGSPGGSWNLTDYVAEEFFQYYSQLGNCPEEFLLQQGSYEQGIPVNTEIEYAVIVCPWYAKPDYPDYAPSGVPDFDQRQWGTYNWTDKLGEWSHCGPVAVADSLWWLDSEFEKITSLPPPDRNDTFPLVKSYNATWDDHDPRNVPYLVEDLAWFMDTDGRRTGLVHSGTNVYDMEAGIAQYLSKVGVNPFGDANGDGVVDQTDLTIVTNALGSQPGDVNWNLAADVNWTGSSYNKIDGDDWNTAHDNLGQKGMFYENTITIPDFFYLEEEFEKCEDVVLLLGFYEEYSPGQFEWVGEHFVTWAGVDSADLKLAVSNPCRDEAETGAWGQVPVPHQHPKTEPPYTTHNDAQYVSHDIYDVQFNPLAGKWELIGYFGPSPTLHAFFNYAVITSPLGVHDINVTSVTTSKDGCTPMPTVSDSSFVNITVTVLNEGNFTETFTVTVYANLTQIASTPISLDPGVQTTLNFTWNTTGWTKGNYTIKSEATQVSGETDLADNTLIDGVIKVVIAGDINGDGTVDIFDAIILSTAFGSKPNQPNWNPNADLDNTNETDIFDAIILSTHFGETNP